ncbi:MAG TPA: cytochrome c oxidase subunit 3 [Allosphingosinicella sp.]|jgi:cytochrome c oxidase subunit 3|nr:cytochrome c oxidase subunit 3 [Allosphingosinicella sp.]
MSEQPPAFQFATAAQQDEASTLGMWTFLATEVLFFGALLAGYSAYRITHPAEFAEAARHTKIVLGTANTAVLLTSSAFIATAVEMTNAGRRRAAALCLALTAALGIAFIAIKGWEYSLEYGEHLVPALNFDADRYGGIAQLFFLFYFFATGLHALHLAIGIALVGGLAGKSVSDRPPETITVRMIGLYWHFVDVVWIFLFPLIYLVGRNQ